MALNGWDNSYSVNNSVMDKDHQKLIQMISSLYDSMKKGQSKSVISPVLADLTNYAENHFSREEKLLSERKNPNIDAQKEQHKVFLSKVNEFKDNFDKGNNSIAVSMLPFLNNWFLNHIMKVDMKYKTAV